MPHFENNLIAVVLPDDWDEISLGDALAFVNLVTGEELAITFERLESPMEVDALAKVVWSRVQERASLMGRHSDDKFQMLAETHSADSLSSRASLTALDSKFSTYGKVTAVGHSECILTVSYSLKKCTEVTEAVIARAELVTGMCRAKAAA